MARINIDLRFLVPPLINLFLYYYFFSTQGEGFLLYRIHIFLNFRRSTLIMTIIILFLAISFVICSSITVPFALTLGNRLTLQFGNFSLPWTASFIASFILSPAVFFYVVFPVTILISPFYGVILDLPGRFSRWLLQTLQRFPVVHVLCLPNGSQHDVDDTQPAEAPQIESPEIELSRAGLEHSSEHEHKITVE